MRSASSTAGTSDGTHCVSPWQRGGASRRATRGRNSVGSRSITIVKELTVNSNCATCTAASTSQTDGYFQGVRAAASLYAAENNSTVANCGCRGRGRLSGGDSSSLGLSSGIRGRPKPADHKGRKKRAAGGVVNGRTAAGDLMGCCVQNTAEQAKQMHIKGTDCKRDNPYAALRTETFRKLLRNAGSRKAAKGRKPGKSARKNTNWCRPKVDECDGMRLQLCPHLGEGHAHEKLIEEVTPVLLQATLNLNCQLREICRRLFFMKHNVPQLTAPALVNFHAILAEITRMLVADFSSFPTGLKLPDRGGETQQR